MRSADGPWREIAAAAYRLTGIAPEPGLFEADGEAAEASEATAPEATQADATPDQPVTAAPEA